MQKFFFSKSNYLKIGQLGLNRAESEDRYRFTKLIREKTFIELTRFPT